MTRCSFAINFIVSFFLLLLYSSLQVNAQNVVFEPFRGVGYFPSNELHGIVEDDAGNKWVASDAGLICITGNNIKVYTRKDGLASDVCLRIYKDPFNRIWVSGPYAVLTLIQNRRVISVPANEELKKIDPASNGIFNLTTGTDSCLYGIFSDGQRKVFKISSDLKHADEVLMNNDGKLLALLFPSIKIPPEKQVEFINSCNVFESAVSIEQPEAGMSFTKALLLMRSIFLTPDSSLIMAKGNYVFHFKGFNLLYAYKFPDRVFSVSSLNGQLIAGIVGAGFQVFDRGRIYPVVNALSKNSITSFLNDNEGNVWATTLENGLLVARSKNLLLGYNGDVIVNRLIQAHGETNILLDNNSIVPFSADATPYLLYFPGHVNDITFTTINGAAASIYYSLNGIAVKSGGVTTVLDKGYYARHARLRSGQLIAWGARNLFVYNSNGIHFYKQCSDKLLCVTSLSDSFMLVGTFSSGLWKVKLDAQLGIERLIENGRINCIRQVGENTYALGTNEDGIVLIDANGKIKREYKDLPGRIQVLEYKDSCLYAGTKEGLFVVNLKNGKISGYNNSNLLPFNEVLDISIKEDQVFMAGRKRVVSIPIAELPAFQPVLKISVNTVMVNNQPHDLNQITNLLHDQNNFSIALNNYSYRSSPNTIYYYNILKSDKIILSDSSILPVIKFSIGPGNYSLQLFAEDKLLHTKSNVETIPIGIRVPVYGEWWFVAIVIFSFLLLFILVTLIITRRIKRRELQKRNLVLKIADLEARALQSQMNPHFVFNAVNSVQDFILSNKAEEAHLFLSDFARLIRMVLEHNRKKNVSIEEEVQLLRLYVSIEEQRLKDKINLEIVMPELLDAENILLPSMLLQPLVENSIWHGLNKIKGEKIIKISFEGNEGLLKISVLDNGRGIVKNAHAHSSVGMEIVKERIRLAYDNEPATDYFSIQNRKDSSGVLVQIILPLETEY